MVVRRQTACCLQEAQTKTWDNDTDETQIYKTLHKPVGQAWSDPVTTLDRKVKKEISGLELARIQLSSESHWAAMI